MYNHSASPRHPSPVCPFLILSAVLWLTSCSHTPPAAHYGFIARLGNDTVSVESITRQGNTLTTDEVDRFPVVRVRHTEIQLDSDGSIKHLVMNIHTPSERAGARECKVIGDVTHDSVHLSKTDSTGTLHRDFRRNGTPVVAHVPQMYSLYELYFAVAEQHAASAPPAAGKPVAEQQFYIDREFDHFPLGDVEVRPLGGGKAEIEHDWLSGTGEATLDSGYHLLSYSGARTTYKVEVTRLSSPPDVNSIASRFEALETKTGAVRQLSVRDTVRAQIEKASFMVDYGRPLVRGRKLLGNIIPYDHVWRTGANAATQFTTSSAIKIAGLTIPAGTYTLWTVPHPDGVDLIVNKESGQWGTEYDGSRNLGTVRMESGALTPPVEAFTISIVATNAQHGTLVMEWGSFRWSAPVEVK